MVVSSDSIKNATATSHGNRSLLASEGTCNGGATTGRFEEFISDDDTILAYLAEPDFSNPDLVEVFLVSTQ
jgi:hypothetical protein